MQSLSCRHPVATTKFQLTANHTGDVINFFIRQVSDMDFVTAALAAVAIAVALLGVVVYRLIKSLEVYLIPLYAEVIRKRERDYVLVEFLTSLLVSKGLITEVEAAALKNVSIPGPLTAEDLDRVDELLDKDPRQLTYEDLIDLKKVAYKLLGRLDKRSVRLGLRLLRYASRVEEAITSTLKAAIFQNADKVEVSYPDCVAETVKTLKALARREEPPDSEKAKAALGRYEKCKQSQAAGCKAINENLSTLEKKSLDILLSQKKTG